MIHAYNALFFRYIVGGEHDGEMGAIIVLDIPGGITYLEVKKRLERYDAGASIVTGGVTLSEVSNNDVPKPQAHRVFIEDDTYDYDSIKTVTYLELAKAYAEDN